MKEILRPIMFVGTCSDAGKSVINAAFCRIFKQDGFSPAPFKAQNMSLNSYSTPEGGEMGRAQVVQAEACGILPHTDMNPVLLKPTNNLSSQVVLNGRPLGNMSAGEYFGQNNSSREYLFREVVSAFKRLEEKYNPIVLEGAGSISELNLRERDITNMRMAIVSNADTYLIADIDRGGVFGSVYGTIALLTPEEKSQIKGVIINKFRGDISLFEEGKHLLEKLTGVPVIGVIPYFRDIKIESEDSVVLEMKNNTFRDNFINVAIVLLKRMSNFTDFDVLEIDPRFNVYYTYDPEEIERADIVIIPGTKNTLSDLQSLRSEGLDQSIIKSYKTGKKVIGICGGYQMMGMLLEDPKGIEGQLKEVKGLELLPIRTVIEEEKTTCQRTFKFLPAKDSQECQGYEIHMGKTTTTRKEKRPILITDEGVEEGFYLSENCWGTYMHGILDNPVVLDYLAESFGKEKTSFNYTEFKEAQYDKLADLVRQHVDMDFIYENLKK